MGEVYSKLAQEFDVEVSADTLDKTFIESFKAAPPPIFPDADNQDILQREFDWWRIIALNTFESAGVLKQFSDFSAFLVNFISTLALLNRGLFILMCYQL